MKSVRRPPSVLLAAALGVASLLAAPAPAQVVNVLAEPVQLKRPTKPVVDANGAVYVAGLLSDNVFRIAPDGTRTVLFDAPSHPGLALDTPRGIAVDSQGVVYVSGTFSDNVLRIEPDGTVTEVLGPDGDGLGHPLDHPSGLAVDDFDRVLVAGASSRTVFRISPDGSVKHLPFPSMLATPSSPDVLASHGTEYVVCSEHVFRVGLGGLVRILDQDGDGTTPFRTVTYRDVELDVNGVVWVAGNQGVFGIDPTGAVSVVPLVALFGIATDLAGSLWVPTVTQSSPATFSTLFEVPPGGTPVARATGGGTYGQPFVDPAGDLYWGQAVATGGDFLWQRTPAGVVTQLMGQLGDGKGNSVLGLEEFATDPSGALVFSGRASDTVFSLVPGAVPLNLLNKSGLNVPTDAPDAVAVDHEGNVYWTDPDRDEVHRLDFGGGLTITKLLDSTGDGAGHNLAEPQDVVVDAQGNVFVSGRVSNNVFRVDPTGAVSVVIDVTGDGAGHPLHGARGLAVDAQGNLFVAGAQSDNVFRVTPSGVVTQMIDATGDGLGNVLSAPFAVAVDGLGNLFVAGRGSDNAFRVTPGGVVTELIDATGDGSSPLSRPEALDVSWAGELFVAGFQSHNLFRVETDGTVTRVLDGTSPATPVMRPTGVAVDAFGTAYVAGSASDTVYRWHPLDGPTLLADEPGAGLAAKLLEPRDVVVDPSGRVFTWGATSQRLFRITQQAWWEDLGGSSLGSNGRPTMSVQGVLIGGLPMARVLTNVPPDTLMLAWVSFASTPLDVIGGTVHAFPPTAQILFVSDATGQSSLTIPWPAGQPSGVDLHLQFVVQDLAVPHGLTLSNAMVRTTP